jgi:hypothetical protein
MNIKQNGVEHTLYTVTLSNTPGSLEEVLTNLKSLNIIGLKLVNSIEFGAVQFVVENEFVKTVSSILSRNEFFYTTSLVYGVYLPNTPSSLLNSIVKPVAKLGVNITNIFTAVGYPRIFVGFDNAKKVIPLLRSIPLETITMTQTNTRTLVTA